MQLPFQSEFLNLILKTMNLYSSDVNREHQLKAQKTYTFKSEIIEETTFNNETLLICSSEIAILNQTLFRINLKPFLHYFYNNAFYYQTRGKPEVYKIRNKFSKPVHVSSFDGEFICVFHDFYVFRKDQKIHFILENKISLSFEVLSGQIFVFNGVLGCFSSFQGMFIYFDGSEFIINQYFFDNSINKENYLNSKLQYIKCTCYSESKIIEENELYSENNYMRRICDKNIDKDNNMDSSYQHDLTNTNSHYNNKNMQYSGHRSQSDYYINNNYSKMPCNHKNSDESTDYYKHPSFNPSNDKENVFTNCNFCSNKASLLDETSNNKNSSANLITDANIECSELCPNFSKIGDVYNECLINNNSPENISNLSFSYPNDSTSFLNDSIQGNKESIDLAEGKFLYDKGMLITNPNMHQSSISIDDKTRYVKDKTKDFQGMIRNFNKKYKDCSMQSCRVNALNTNNSKQVCKNDTFKTNYYHKCIGNLNNQINSEIYKSDELLGSNINKCKCECQKKLNDDIKTVDICNGKNDVEINSSSERDDKVVNSNVNCSFQSIINQSNSLNLDLLSYKSLKNVTSSTNGLYKIEKQHLEVPKNSDYPNKNQNIDIQKNKNNCFSLTENNICDNLSISKKAIKYGNVHCFSHSFGLENLKMHVRKEKGADFLGILQITFGFNHRADTSTIEFYEKFTDLDSKVAEDRISINLSASYGKTPKLEITQNGPLLSIKNHIFYTHRYLGYSEAKVDDEIHIIAHFLSEDVKISFYSKILAEKNIFEILLTIEVRKQSRDMISQFFWHKFLISNDSLIKEQIYEFLTNFNKSEILKLNITNYNKLKSREIETTPGKDRFCNKKENSEIRSSMSYKIHNNESPEIYNYDSAIYQTNARENQDIKTRIFYFKLFYYDERTLDFIEDNMHISSKLIKYTIKDNGLTIEKIESKSIQILQRIPIIYKIMLKNRTTEKKAKNAILSSKNVKMYMKQHLEDDRLEEVSKILGCTEIGVFENEDTDIDRKMEMAYTTRMTASIGNIYFEYGITKNDAMMGYANLQFRKKNMSQTLNSGNSMQLTHNDNNNYRPSNVSSALGYLQSHGTNDNTNLVDCRSNYNIKDAQLVVFTANTQYSSLANLFYNCNNVYANIRSKECTSQTHDYFRHGHILQNLQEINPISDIMFSNDNKNAKKDISSLSGAILGLGLASQITQEMFDALESNENETVLLCLYIGYAYGLKGRLDENLHEYLLKKYKSNPGYITQLGVLMALGLLFSSTNDYSIMQLLTNEINKNGVFSGANNKGNRIWYNEDYKIFVTFALALVTNDSTKYIKLENKLCELILNGCIFALSNNKKIEMYLERDDYNTLEEIFYSSLFTNLITIEKPISAILSEIRITDLLKKDTWLQKKISLQKMYEIAGKIYYIAFKSLKEGNKDNLDIIMQLFLVLEEIKKSNPSIDILYKTTLLTLCIMENGSNNINIIRILRRQIKKTERIINLNTINTFVIDSKESKQFGMRFGEMLYYKMCLGLTCLGHGVARLKFNKKCVFNIVASFYVCWPLSVDDQRHTFFMRYLLLDSLEIRDDILSEIVDIPLLSSHDANNPNQHGLIYDGMASIIELDQSEKKKPRNREESNSKNDLYFKKTNTNREQNIGSDNQNTSIQKTDYFNDKLEMNNKRKYKYDKLTYLEQEFLVEYNRMNSIDRRLSLDILADYFEQNENNINFTIFAKLLAENYLHTNKYN